MAGPPYLGDEQIRRMLPMEHAVMALEAAFRAGPPGSDAPAARAGLGGGELVLSAGERGRWAAARLTTAPASRPASAPTSRPSPAASEPVTGAWPAGDGGHFGDGGAAAVFVVFEAAELRPRLLLDARALAVLRAAAASALATRHLAKADARRLVVLGTGADARAHVRAMLAVRQPDEVRVVGQDPHRARRLAGELDAEHGAKVIPGTPDDVAEADIVCVCRPGPLFAGPIPVPAPGSHVNVLGGRTPEPGSWRPYVVGEHAGMPGCDTDLHHVLTGEGTPPPGAPTLFTSSGLIAEDLVLAAELAAKLG
ncbi:ornithine cyclodeaminase [Nonomuraea coxensis DSM 45129]|uniref:Ornithine cyclodeaminase n=1 Tax=Nonomuraea coxensis DSM 45129 TaxID=1122611 RepID=A0ABX8U794_9ACTN|nr:hypothetical protein [Nonomuraea coxensis]QYC42629.1 ornithine cyclodeaminase [Nonomuraea coxensis DSM 45129]